MSRHRSSFRLAVAGVFAATSVAGQAAAPGSVESLLSCSAVKQETTRLACYDREATLLKDAVSSRELVVLDRSEVQRTRRSLFGFSLPSLKIFGKGEASVEAGEVKRLDTRIVSVGRAPGYGLYSLQLAEGGTWQTIEANRDFEPVAGQTILIERGVIGNYNAKVAGRRAVRVKRVG